MPQPWVNADFKQQSTFSRLDPQTKQIEMETRSFAKPYTKNQHLEKVHYLAVLGGMVVFPFCPCFKIFTIPFVGMLGVCFSRPWLGPSPKHIHWFTPTWIHESTFGTVHASRSLKTTKSWVTCSLDSTVWWNCCISLKVWFQVANLVACQTLLSIVQDLGVVFRLCRSLSHKYIYIHT